MFLIKVERNFKCFTISHVLFFIQLKIRLNKSLPRKALETSFDNGVIVNFLKYSKIPDFFLMWILISDFDFGTKNWQPILPGATVSIIKFHPWVNIALIMKGLFYKSCRKSSRLRIHYNQSSFHSRFIFITIYFIKGNKKKYFENTFWNTPAKKKVKDT